MTTEESNKICRQAADSISEHYDAVLILTSWTEEGVTRYSYIGSGNEFARVGMADHYTTTSKDDELADRLAKAITEDEEWGDDD